MIRSITPALSEHIHSSASHRLEPLEQTVWDACVVGSGPGGAVAATTLAEAGWRVLVVERGSHRPPEQLNFRVLDMALQLGHLELTQRGRITLHQGNVLGGGSVIYGGVAMKPPAFVLDEWTERSHTDVLSAQSLAPHYEHVANIMSVTPQNPALENRSNAIVRQMAAALGQSDGLELAQRYTQGCAGTGLCNLGCGLDLKGTMTNSFIPIGLETGNLTILTDCEVLTLDGAHRGSRFEVRRLHVAVRDFSTGTTLATGSICARVFVIAAGALFSCGLLRRTPAIASTLPPRKISLQPHAVVYAEFEEAVTPAHTANGLQKHGVPVVYNFTGMMRPWRYYWFASVLHPASLASYASHLPPDAHLALMKKFHYVSSVTITLRDDPARSRLSIRNGRPQLDFQESAGDIRCLRRSFLDAARAFLAVGARQVLLPMLQPPRIERVADLAAIEHLDLSYERLLLYSDHISGGNCIDGIPGRGVTDGNGRVARCANLYVTDSSLFPSACGVGPSWTIMALSRRLMTQLMNASP